jgi:hypothetical protein
MMGLQHQSCGNGHPREGWEKIRQLNRTPLLQVLHGIWKRTQKKLTRKLQKMHATCPIGTCRPRYRPDSIPSMESYRQSIQADLTSSRIAEAPSKGIKRFVKNMSCPCAQQTANGTCISRAKVPHRVVSSMGPRLNHPRTVLFCLHWMSLLRSRITKISRIN